MRVLVAGWFSFEEMGATAGDLLVRDLVCDWLRRSGCPYEVALAPPFSAKVDWRQMGPASYTHVVFACGPFGNGWPVTEFLERFRHCRLIGINLTMLESLESWNPFDLLLERDSSRASRPDLVFLAPPRPVPLAGLVLIHPQPEYGARDLHQAANDALRRLVCSREMAAVSIDTRLDTNATGLRTPAEIESLIARMDVILTTRLHGAALGLKNGVPVLAIDPVAGGAKIRTQAETIGWPVIFLADRVTDQQVEEAFAYCLTEEARQRASACAQRARQLLDNLPQQFLAGLAPERK